MHPSIFLDIEAEEDREGSGEEGTPANSDDDADFLDDEVLQSTPAVVTHEPNTLLDECQEVTNYVTELAERARKRRRLERNCTSKSSTFPEEVPPSNDFLWRVKCQPGSQDQLMTCILHADTLKDVLTSAFVIPTVRNWVYIQCSSVNRSMMTFLSASTTVIKAKGQAVLEKVPLDEQDAILNLRGRRNIQPQDWVIITKGIYRQDLGCVSASHEWGLDVLVIPRLFPTGVQGRKTKAQTVQGLFVPGRAARHFGSSNQIHSIMKPAPNCKPEVDRGLLVLECEHHGVQRASTAPVSTLGLFNQSQHPVVLNALVRAPCPAEWHFEIGELVRMTGGPKRNEIGTVVEINESGLELTDESGTHYCPFLWAEKIVASGDYVRCVNNSREGFVQIADDFSVSLLEQHDDGQLDELRCDKNSVVKVLPPRRDIKVHAIHWIGARVTVTDPKSTLHGQEAFVKRLVNTHDGLAAVIVGHEVDPFLPSTSETHLNFQHYGLRASQSSDVEEYRHTSGRTPWVGLQVVVHTERHPLRTKIGTVRDVICGQKNESGLAVIIILDNYDPASTNKEYAVDYADVLDVETGRPLRFVQLLKPSQKDFMPRQSFLASRREEKLALAGEAIRSQPLISRRPDTPPLKPAWDPRSKTPPRPGVPSEAGPSLSPPRTYEHHGHWMTDPRLVDRELHVHVGSKAKVMVIQKRSDGAGMQAYIRKGKKKLEPIQPGMAAAMEPATPRNYERWIIIKGDNTGKYVRSIRYKKGATPKMPIWWTVAVVEPVEGEVDRMVGEELHLDSTPCNSGEAGPSSRVRLAEPDLPYDEDKYRDLMWCPKGHQHIHSTCTRGDRIGEQFLFCHRGSESGCARRLLFRPSSSLRLELAQILKADKHALSLKGKSKAYEQATKRLDKAKAALTKATDAADSDGGKIMYNKSIESAARKLTAARTKARQAQNAYEASLAARRALDAVALCTDNASVRAYLVSHGLADSIEGSERRVLTAAAALSCSVFPEQPNQPASSSKHGNHAVQAKNATSTPSGSSKQELLLPTPPRENDDSHTELGWPSNVELIEEVVGDTDWPSDVEIVSVSYGPRKRKASQTATLDNIKRIRAEDYVE
ncbi:hypothetical protein IW261DRAFT_1424446 [Armillaria novae-zelandiae]|uniref:KOW domain-containing protein n=1 Tax=Armillaria novae-zelandiae TaxID=153914 RepID=A0AA39U1P4_9AGAR|nr:hypothetical protein IW261DRAFT_1424446 [Armillaria novae-zelandiae]